MEKFALPTMHELFLMHARADRAMRAVVGQQLESRHLTLMEWLALGAISAGAKKGLSMTEVARSLNVTLPQVTALVTGLIELKCVKQKVLLSDHRGRQVIITLKGRRVLHKLEILLAKSYKKWTKDVSTANMRHYLATVEQLSGEVD